LFTHIEVQQVAATVATTGDGNTVTLNVTSTELGGLTDGDSYKLRLYETAKNNEANEVASFTFTVDTTIPTVSITGPAVIKNTTIHTVSGSGTAGATITLTSDAVVDDVAAGDDILGGTGLVDSNGDWTTGAVTFAEAAHTITATVTDLAGNTATAQQSVTIDVSAPTMTITAKKVDNAGDALDSGETTNDATLFMTFTASEETADFELGDITVSGGTIDALTTPNHGSAGHNTVFTGTFTPTDTGISGLFERTCEISVDAGVFTDAAGNSNVAATLPSSTTTTYTWTHKTTKPTMTMTAQKVDSDGDALASDDITNDQTIFLTFTASETVTGFLVGDITVSNCSLDALTANSDNTVFTTTLTPDSNSETCTVSVAANKFTDAYGNNNVAATLPSSTTTTYTWVHKSTTPSAFTVQNVTTTGTTSGSTIKAGYLNAGNTGLSVVVPIEDDDSLVGGTVQLKVSTDTGANYASLGTAESIISGNINTNKTISRTIVPADYNDGDTLTITAVITDAIGNETTGTASSTTLTVDITSPSSFTTGALSATGTANSSSAEAGYINAGNNAVSVVVPIANDSTLEDGTVQLQIQVGTGSFSNLGAAYTILDTDLGTDKTLSRTIDPTDYTDNNAISVKAVITDVAGNTPTESTSGNTLTVNREAPTIAISAQKSSSDSTAIDNGAKTNDATIHVTFTASDDVLEVSGSDDITVTSTGGTFTGAITRINATTYTGTFTPTADGDCTFDVAAGAFKDVAGNPSTAAATQFVWKHDDTAPTTATTGTVAISGSNSGAGVNKTAIINETNTQLTVTVPLDNTGDDLYLDNAGTVTQGSIQIQYKVGTGSWNDLGSATNIVAIASGASSTQDVAVSIVSGSPAALLSAFTADSTVSLRAQVTDIAGNETSHNASTNTFTVKRARPTMEVLVYEGTDDTGTAVQNTRISDYANKAVNSSNNYFVKFTASEAIENFVVGDVTVSGGTLGNFAATASSYTATFTPDAGAFQNCSISVAANKFNSTATGNDNETASESPGDTAGNQTVGAFTFKHDTTAPSATTDTVVISGGNVVTGKLNATNTTATVTVPLTNTNDDLYKSTTISGTTYVEQGSIQIQYSVNGGTNWTDLGSATNITSAGATNSSQDVEVGLVSGDPSTLLAGFTNDSTASFRAQVTDIAGNVGDYTASASTFTIKRTTTVAFTQHTFSHGSDTNALTFQEIVSSAAKTVTIQASNAANLNYEIHVIDSDGTETEVGDGTLNGSGQITNTIGNDLSSTTPWSTLAHGTDFDIRTTIIDANGNEKTATISGIAIERNPALTITVSSDSGVGTNGASVNTGNDVTVAVTSDIDLATLAVTTNSHTFGGDVATGSTALSFDKVSGNAKSWIGTYTIDSGDTAGAMALEVVGTTASTAPTNSAATTSSTINTGSITIDRTAPAFTAFSLLGGLENLKLGGSNSDYPTTNEYQIVFKAVSSHTGDTPTYELKILDDSDNLLVTLDPADAGVANYGITAVGTNGDNVQYTIKPSFISEMTTAGNYKLQIVATNGLSVEKTRDSSVIAVKTATPSIDSVAPAWLGTSDSKLNATEDGSHQNVVVATTNVEDGQAVTVEIIDSSNATVITDTATVSSNSATVSVASGDLSGLTDASTYTVKASVSDAFGVSASDDSTTFTVDKTAPTNKTVGTVAAKGATSDNEVAGKFNTNNTSIEVTVPIADDDTLVGGTVQLQIEIGTAGFNNFGSAFTIASGDVSGNGSDQNKTCSVTHDTTSYTDGDVLSFKAIVTDSAGNSSTFTESGSTLTVDKTVPTITSATAAWGAVLNTSEATSSTNADRQVAVVTTNVEDGQVVTVSLTNDSEGTCSDTAHNNQTDCTNNSGTWTATSVSKTGAVSGNNATIQFTASELQSIGQGACTLRANVQDQSGNAATENTFSFSVDTVHTLTFDNTSDSVNAFSWGTVLNKNEAETNQTVTVTTSGIDNNTVASLQLYNVSDSANVGGVIVALVDGTNNEVVFDITTETLNALDVADSYRFIVSITDDGNGNSQSTNSHNFTIDKSQPTMTITAKKVNYAGVALAPGQTTNDATLHMILTASEVPTTDLVASDFTVNNATLGTLTTDSSYSGSGRRYTATLTPTDTGSSGEFLAACSISLDADVFTDPNGNGNIASSAYTWTHDSVKPEMTITARELTSSGDVVTSGDTTNAATLHMTFVSTKAATGLEAADFTLSGGSLGALATSDNFTHTATFTPAADQQVSYTIGLDAGKYTDSLGNNNEAATQFAYISDLLKPSMSIAAKKVNSDGADLASGETTNDATLHMILTASEVPTTDLVADDFTVNNATLSNFSGSGQNYTATLTPTDPGSSGEFLAACSISLSADVFTDPNGNGNIASSAYTWTHDSVKPEMTITARELTSSGEVVPTGDTTNAATLHMTFVSTKATTNLVSSDFTISPNSGASAGSLSTLSTSDGGLTHTATFTPASNQQVDYTIGLNAGSYTDAVGNNNEAATQFTYTSDLLKPTMTITAKKVNSDGDDLASGETTNDATLHMILTASEDTTNLVASDFTVNNATLSNFSGSGQNYTAILTPTDPGSSGEFLAACSISLGADVFTDPNGNSNLATSSTFTWTHDSVKPEMTISAKKVNSDGDAVASGDTTNAATLHMTFVSTKAATGLTSSDFTLSGGSLSALATSDNLTHTATFTPASNQEVNYTIDLDADKYTDAVGNNNKIATQFAYTSDLLKPSMTITAQKSSSDSTAVSSGSTTNDATLHMILTASEVPTTDLLASNFTVNNATLGTLTTDTSYTGSGKRYTATLTPNSDNESCSISLGAGEFTDPNGNPNLATSSAFAWNHDSVEPEITISAKKNSSAGADLANNAITNDSQIYVTFSLTKAVTDFAQNDISLTNCNITSFSGSGDTYNAIVQPNGSGLRVRACTISVDSDECNDQYGNGNNASNTWNWTHNSTIPTMAITAKKVDYSGDDLASGQTTNDATLHLTFTASEDATGFEASDIVVTGGTINDSSGSTTFTSTSATVYTATFTPDSNDEICSISVGGAVFTDAAGNANTSASFSWTHDSVKPTIGISAQKSSSDSAAIASGSSTKDATIHMIFTTSEVPTGLVAADFTVSGGSLGALSGSGTIYTATFTPNSDNVSCSISLDADKFTDPYGNGNIATTTAFTWDHDSHQPEITGASLTAINDISVSTGTTTKIGDEIEVTVVFDEDVIVPSSGSSLVIENGDNSLTLALKSGQSNGRSLVYEHTVVASTNTNVTIGAFVIVSITNIKDLRTNILNYTAESQAVTNLGLDSKRPKITGVEATATKIQSGNARHLREGDELTIDINFDENILLTNTLVAKLNSGKDLEFTSSGANDVLTATYVIDGTENSSGFLQINKLVLPSGSSLLDVAGNSIATQASVGRSLTVSSDLDIAAGSGDTANNFTLSTGDVGADIVIDTTNPTNVITLPPQVDINGDGTATIHLTNNSTPIIAGQTESEANVKLYILDSNDATDLLIINPYTTTANTSGQWQIYAQGHQFKEGVNYINLVTTDLAGNVNSDEVKSFTVDTSKPAQPSITSSLITNASSAYTLTGFTEPYSELTIDFSTDDITTQTISSANTANGSFSISIDITSLADGEYPFTISSNAMDAAGNVSDATIGVLVKDTTAITADIEIYHLGNKITQETYLKEGDVINVKVTFNKNVTASEALEFKFMDDNTNVKSIPSTLLINKSEINVSYTIRNADLGKLKIHSIGSTIQANNPTDAAGNKLLQITDQTFTNVICDSRTISIGNPIETSTSNATDYYGINDTLEISLPLTFSSLLDTNIDGVEDNVISIQDGTYLQLSNGGKAIYDATTETFKYKLIEGDNNFSTLTVQYSIGEISHKSGVKASSIIFKDLSVNGIANKPSVPVINHLPSLTNTDPTITGSVGASATQVILHNGSSDLSPITPDTYKNWTLTLTGLSDGLHNIKAKAVDAAGNMSDYSIPKAVTMDATAPTIVTAATHSPAGTVNSGDMTISIDIQDASGLESVKVVVTDSASNSKTVDATLQSGNTYQAVYTIDDQTADGVLSYVVNITDKAGNTTTSASQIGTNVDKIGTQITSVIASESGDDISLVITLGEVNNNILANKVKLVDSEDNEYLMDYFGTQYSFKFNNFAQILAEGPLSYKIEPFADAAGNETQRGVTDTGIVISYNVAPQFTKSDKTYTRSVELKKYGITTMLGNVHAAATDSNDDMLTYSITGGNTIVTQNGDFSQKEGTFGTLTIDDEEGFFTYKTNDTIASQLAYNEQIVDTYTIIVTDGELSDTATVEITLVGKMCNDESSCNYGSLGPCATNDCLGSCNGSAQKSGKVCYKVVTV